MTDEEYSQYTAFLRPDQWEELGKVAKGMGIGSRQPLLRWAIDAFLMSKSSTYQTISDSEDAKTADIAA
jgi:hypothetical protein